MAYMNQERKKKLTENVKKALVGTGLKFTTKVRNHSTIVLTFKSGPVDFIGDLTDRVRTDVTYTTGLSVNPYWFREHFTGLSKDVLEKTITALNDGNHDRSDIMTDYFDEGWYVVVNIGTWEKPYIVTR